MNFSVDDRIICFGVLCIVFYGCSILGVVLSIAITTCVVFVTESYACKLDEDSLSKDLAALETLYDVDNIINTPVLPSDVELYYEQTTSRDHGWLQVFNVPGMHSTMCLEPPIGQVCGASLQAMLVLEKICTKQCKRVMEVGCGQGFCSLFLAKMCPGVQFTGTDILPTHIKIAQSQQTETGLYKNAEFKVGDAIALEAPVHGAKFDLIFAVEALCYLDTPQKRNAFLTRAYNCLGEAGIVVIIDGFRSDTFEMCSHNQRRAMQLAEKGFRINAMPAKSVWKQHAADLNFAVTEDVDFTRQVIPFWQRGWRVAHFILNYAFIIKKVTGWLPCAKQSAASFLSTATAAHAFRNRGAAEYGMITLQKADLPSAFSAFKPA